MINPIPENINKLWEHWNIRGVILLSLSMQIFLIMSSPLRKRVQKGLVLSSIWAAYLLADWAANFCVGLITSNQIPSSKTIISTHSDLLAFWAPFLLLHLGGPDTITAFSLEDNELWLRHMLGSFIQVISCLYVFLITVPGNRLWIPTVLVFVAGMMKYGERIYALYLASNDIFRESMNGKPTPGSNYSRLMSKYLAKTEANLPTRLVKIPDPHAIPKHDGELEKLDDIRVLQDAYRFFDKFKGIIVDMIFSFPDRNESRQYFHSIKAEDALRVIEVELNFFYEAFYTKFLVVRSYLGYLLRFVAISCIAAALGFFFSLDKQKQGFDGFDVKVTYALLCGAIALDAMALLVLFFSDRTIVSLPQPLNANILYIRLKRPKWSKCKKEPYTKFKELSTWVLLRRWNGSISGFNLISYCRPKKTSTPAIWWEYTIVDVVQQIKSVVLNRCRYSWFVIWLHEVKNPFLLELWEFIFSELKRKSAEAEDVETTQRICNSRGGWVLQEGVLSHDQRKELMPYVDANEVAFDESLILWHIATHLCYSQAAGDGKGQVIDEREFSKLLSDYMLYLLVVQSHIISAVAGIGQKRFQDTVAEATLFFKEKRDKNDADACKRLLDVPTNYKPTDVRGDASKSLLFDACRLAQELGKLKENIKWRIICQVWVELLSFAACNCRISTHVQHLSKGGELISLVWLLMIRLGLGKQFQIRGAQAKLIVGE